MLRRMLVLRAVAATDMAADQAHPQINPCIAGFYTLLADRYILRMDVADLVFMGTNFISHKFSIYYNHGFIILAVTWKKAAQAGR